MLDLPPAAIEALAHYRRLLRERGWDWGDDRIELFRWVRFSLFGPIFEAYAATGDWPGAVREVIGDDVPAGVAVVHLDEDGHLTARTGPPRPHLPGRKSPLDVVFDSTSPHDVRLTLHEGILRDETGTDIAIPATGTAVVTVDGPFTVTFGDETLAVDAAFTTAEAAELHLTSPRCARWSVTDAAGGAWFPDGVLPKWDVHHRPFFHAHDVKLQVPAGPLHVTCTRGIEFDRVEQDVEAQPARTTPIAMDPARLHDPAATGWYGGDLHIHLNYSGDLVCHPADAARMQLGEGLHVASLVAGNCQTSLVYDRELLETTAGTDLPWSGGDVLARMGVEYRNDLLGHVHAFAPETPPQHYYSGFERSGHPADWPPNSVACQELRESGAAVGYAHPAFTAFPEDGSTERFFRNPRSVEARELVADAALGLVDSLELISPFDDEGAAFLYYRLLSCGLRLAATAGTDTFLSFSHGPGTASNPPGWGRVYAFLGDRPLSAESFKEAVRAGRTAVTNGPWIELDVAGNGPGAVLDLAGGETLELRARVTGPGAQSLALVGPDGVIAETGASELRTAHTVTGPAWIAAVARGPAHPNTLDESVFAHTSPVYVDVAGRRVARAADARWCLDYLDDLERFAVRHGRFEPGHGPEDLRAVIERARAFYRPIAAS